MKCIYKYIITFFLLHLYTCLALNTTKWTPEVPGRTLISILTVEQVNPSDAGVYICRSMTPTNNRAVDTTSIIVHILNGKYPCDVYVQWGLWTISEYLCFYHCIDYPSIDDFWVPLFLPLYWLSFYWRFLSTFVFTIVLTIKGTQTSSIEG
jgi:hypothetical protein